ncbi:MAG: M15 family metallopeptidase [Candidatus Eremiobacteraeota bacterium]|nr:M15 family metallopeptidase [Candidatus Eremiobacteraeota bacterium]
MGSDDNDFTIDAVQDAGSYRSQTTQPDDNAMPQKEAASAESANKSGLSQVAPSDQEESQGSEASKTDRVSISREIKGPEKSSKSTADSLKAFSESWNGVNKDKEKNNDNDKESGSLKEIHKRLENNSEIKNRIKDLDDTSRASVSTAAEDAYRKAKKEGAEDWKALRAATEAGNEKSKEAKRDSDRSKEIENLSPGDRERADKIRQRSVSEGNAQEKSPEEIKKTADKAVDAQLNNMKREKALDESISKMNDEQRETMRREMDKAYVAAMRQGMDDEQCKKEAVDRGRVVEKIDGSKSLSSGMKDMNQDEKGSVYQASHDSYKQEMQKSGDERKSMQNAEESARKTGRDIQKDHSSLKELQRAIENGSTTRQQYKSFDEKEKTSVSTVAEEAYKSARQKGESNDKAVKAAKEAASARVNEIQGNHNRIKEMEKLDPAMRERVQGAMQQASQNARLGGSNDIEQERAAGRAGDQEIKDIGNEQFVEKYKGKMSEEDQKAVDKASQEAYNKAISEGKSPQDAKREGTGAAMEKVEPSKTLPPLEVPKGYSEKTKTFGEPGSHQTKMKMPAGKNGEMIEVTCHEKLAERMKTMFEEVRDRGKSHLLKQDFGGCSYYRDTTGGGSLSNHSWGIAFDVNAGQPGNGFNTSYPTEDQNQLAEIFEKYGFKQLKNDRMHFEYCTGS